MRIRQTEYYTIQLEQDEKKYRIEIVDASFWDLVDLLKQTVSACGHSEDKTNILIEYVSGECTPVTNGDCKVDIDELHHRLLLSLRQV